MAFFKHLKRKKNCFNISNLKHCKYKKDGKRIPSLEKVVTSEEKYEIPNKLCLLSDKSL